MLKIKPSTIFYFCAITLLYTTKMVCQENYSSRWYTSDNNELPQSSVKAIVKDKYNFIWLTTENGLVRYDGNNFQVYNPSTANLQGCRFTQILGNVQADSLYCYTEKEQVLINQRKIQITKEVQQVVKLKDGKRFLPHDGLPSFLTVHKFAPYYIRLSNNNIYFIDNSFIELCDSKMRTIYKRAYKNNNIFNFFALGNVLYYLKENGEYDYFTPTGRSSGKLPPEFFSPGSKLYWNLTARQVFIYSKNKIYLLSSNQNRLSLSAIIEFADFDKSNILSLLYDDKNQKMYLGSSTRGLCIISLPSFKATKRISHPTEVFYSSVPFSTNSVVTSDGLIVNANKVEDSIPFLQSKIYNEKTAMTKDEKENFWIIRGFNVLCYLKEHDYKKHVYYTFKQPIKTLFTDRVNRVWISTVKFEGSTSKLYYLTNLNDKAKLAAKLDNDINFIAQYDANTLYLGSTQGLYKYNIKTGKLFFIKNSDKLNIRSIFIDHEKKIWLTTYEKGFFLYTDATIYSFPLDKNRYLSSSHCMMEDKNGFFWISTNKGLFQVSRKTLLSYRENKARTIYYYHYDKADGFLTNEFNGGCQPCGNYLKNGQITLPSMNGIVFYDPDKIRPLLPNKEIFIGKIIMDKKVVPVEDTIILKNNFQRVRFLLAYPYYGNPDNLTIEAKLEGATNSQWEKIGPERSISFTTLPNGEYTLVIRSMSGFNSDYVYKKITLIVPAKFYETLWFIVLCAFLTINFIVSLWYMRLQYVKRKNKQLKQIIEKKTSKLSKTVRKLKIVQDSLKQEAEQQEMLIKSISHDIKSPLKFLTSSVTHLFDSTYIQQDRKLKRQVETIHRSTVHLFEYVENLIKYSTIFLEGRRLEEQSYSLNSLIREKIQIFEKIAKAENTVIVNSIEKNTFIKTNNKALSIIVHNLLDNAVKHTQKGRIELLCCQHGNMLTLSIKDTGKGMSQDQIDYYMDFYKNPIVKNYHLGLHMIIELLVLLKGTIKIESEIDQGTTIEITMECS